MTIERIRDIHAFDHVAEAMSFTAAATARSPHSFVHLVLLTR